jgi:hypothetical protein
VPTHSHGESEAGFLRTSGVFIPVEVSDPRGMAGRDRGVALIDFGASMTFIRTTTALGLDLQRTGPLPILTGAGQFISFAYLVSLTFPTLDWEVRGHTVGGTGGLGSVSSAPPQPILVLVGRDLLERVRFEWNGPEATWALHYP